MPSQTLNIAAANQSSQDEFLQIFGNVVEHSPDVVEKVFARAPFVSVAAMVGEFELYLDAIKTNEKVAILKRFPDLAGKMADENRLTAESTSEHEAAGLHALTAERKTQLAQLNKEYLEKFGFPFVICVRAANKIEAILKGLHERLPNPQHREIMNGIDEVKKITMLRIESLVHD